MIELFGNSIWNNNTPNTDKKVIIADEKELKKIEQSINNAGFNYCAYIRKGNAYIAVNKNDVENIHKLNINIKAVSNSNNKPYKPNKIIGNTPFKNINNKYYQKYSADIAYAVAYRLDELNIPFSGKLYDVYNSVTITIDKAYVEQIQSIAKEITEQRSLIANSNGKITNAIKDAVKKLNYSEEQLKSINKAKNLLLDRIDDENLLSAFDAMFEGTNKYSADDIAKLSDEFVKIFENLHGLECVFASRNDFNGLKKEFDKNILFEKYTQDKGFSSEQEKVIKNMIDKNMDSVLDILDFTFSVSEMEDMYLAYQQGDYDRLINIVASVKDTSRIEIEGEIESGTYTPVLPNYDTLDRDLFFNNPDSESVTHIYYNSDANSGGQFVISEINYYEIENALKKFSDKSDDVETFFDYLDSISEQKCIDIGDDLFLETYQKFYSNEHIAEGITDEVKKQLTNIATVNYTVPDKTDYYKSYFEIQSEHPDAIILFRVGDFYEVLGDNAQEAAEALNLTLMSRTINGEKIPMVGFPSSYLEDNENLLVEIGYKILTVEREDIAERASLRNKAQEVAKQNNLPFSDKFSMGFEDDFDTAVYDGSMSADDYEKLQQADIEPKADRPTVAYFPAKAQDENEVTQNIETEQPTLFDFDNGDTLFSDAAHTTVEKGKNYVMEDRETVTGAKTKFKNNITAIRILKTLESENRKATVAEQRQLSLYTGWGGLANAFEPDNDKWKNEYLELKNLLTDDEYTAARSSVLDAFYTDSTIIDSIYKVIQNAGLESGNILEPAMGIGNFFGRLPADLRGKVNLYGVEKDSLSGRIAQKLYPQANITIDGFENTHFNDNSFDVAIGNIPFGDFGVNDKKYNSQNLKIHDYFFLKSLDKVRDGGIVAFVTSKGTLDKKDSSFRKTLAERADLVGAVRLPNNAFKSAGTEVTADIIFLQKREKKLEIEPSWVHTGQLETGLPVNNYFVKHPEMVLGEIVEGNKMYGRTDDTMCVPFDDGRTLSDLLAIAVNNISFTYTPHKDKLIPLAEKSDEIILPQGIRAESYFKSNNDIYFYGSNGEGDLFTIPGSELLDKKYTAKNINRISDFIELRDTLRELLDVQQYENNDDKVAQLQSKLNTLYDDYYIKYGLLHSNYNRNIIGFDGAYQLVASLEKSYDKSKLIEKSDIFTQRVNVPKPTIEHIDTAEEALAISIAEKGVIDFAYMSKLTDIPEENLKANLCANGEIFPVPELSSEDNIVYQTASEYLSGDIYAKLDMANLSARDNDIYRSNIIALEKAKPKPLKAADIDVSIGATWISPKYYEQFMYEIFKTPEENRSNYAPKYYWQKDGKKIEVEYSAYSGRWSISNKSIDKSVTVTKTYGAHGYSGYAIFQSALNLTEPKVYKIKLDEFGIPVFDKNHKPVSELDVPATQVVQQKANAIRREFKNWLFKDADRRKDIIDTYNRTFNCIKPREYDGSHLTFPGMNSNIELHEHQKNAIAHAIFGGNTLFAHSVGAGKTFEMIATAMECKRLGMCHKSLFAVPNHLTEQVGDDFLKLYPNANILVATKEDFKADNRKKLMSKIATGNYDAVIIGHTQLKMLPLSPERQQAIYQEQIDNIIKGIAELKAQDGSNFKIKDMERTKKNLEKQLAKLQSAKKDNSIYFEELGIDKLFVDEAHEFKNLFCTTKLQNVSGISSRASQRATELFAKCRYLDEKTGGRGVVFATGTPISNSVTELHTMMRYLNYDFLANHNNMQNFDNWVSTFGVQKKEYELAPAGNKFKERTRIAEYSNLPELISMFKLIADVRTSDTLNLNVPDCEMHILDVEPTELQKELVDELSDRADDVNVGKVDPSEDNMLKITGDGRKLGLDPRLIDPEFEDNPGTKLNVCVNKVFEIYEKTSDKKLTQIVFCDLGVPGKNVSADTDGKDDDTKSVSEIDSLEETGKFCVYDDIKSKLIAKGVPAEEIAFIHDAKNEKQKSELFAKVRSGEVRVLLGSTGKMGTGTNVQDRIIALHDLDVPWRPSDLEQRRGRMVRQGNINKKVHLYRYVTKGTFDAYSYQLLEKKQKFISQIMTSKAPARKCSDVDQASLSYSEIKALCTGDERIREKLTLENRVKELTAYKSEYDNTRYELEDKVNAYPEQRKDLLCTIGNIQKDIDKLNALPKDDEGTIVYTYNFGDAAYTNSEEDRKSAAKALGAFVALSRQHRNETIKVGDISGYEVEIINKGLIVDDITARLGNGKYKVNFGSLNIHNLSKLENLFTKFNEFLSNAKKELNRIDYDYNSAKEMLTKPFEFEQELTEKTNRLAELTTALNIDLAQRQNVSSERKTCYFSKNSILHRTKNKIAPEQNKPEIKRSAPEL
ncbi:SNF2-related protein [Ruminococcus intestinalis]|uniref:SNF2-related protein n=1 Tax=Ruminococcus intestinalis TaxID=2763066 RepID=UPI003F7DBB70